ncbi:tetratricopeptide repeat protein [Rubrivivax albus]|nr:hypothetical protein [Rubrivivax albus]
MSTKTAVHSAYTKRFMQPKPVGIFGIDPKTRQAARDSLTGRAPDFEPVVASLEQAEHIDQDPGALRTLAGARLMMGIPAESLRLLQQAEGVLKEELGINYATRVMSHIALGELELAVQMGRQAIAVSPRHYMGYVNLGAALIEQGDPEGALQVLTELRTTWPEGLQDAELRARVLVEDGQWAFVRADAAHRARLDQLFNEPSEVTP